MEQMGLKNFKALSYNEETQKFFEVLYVLILQAGLS